jgi:hypothetical protein
MRDLFNNLDMVAEVAPTSVTSDTTTNGEMIVRDDSFGLVGVLQVGSYTSGEFYLEVEHADDDGTGNPDEFEPVPDKDLNGTESGTLLGGAGIAMIGYVGGKEYVRFNVVSQGGASGSVSAAALKGYLNSAPAESQTA